MEQFYPMPKTEESPSQRVLDESKRRLVSELEVAEESFEGQEPLNSNSIKPFGTAGDNTQLDLSQTAILTEIQQLESIGRTDLLPDSLKSASFAQFMQPSCSTCQSHVTPQGDLTGPTKDVCLSSFEHQQKEPLFDCSSALRVHAQSTSTFGRPRAKRLSLTESVVLI